MKKVSQTMASVLGRYFKASIGGVVDGDKDHPRYRSMGDSGRTGELKSKRYIRVIWLSPFYVVAPISNSFSLHILVVELVSRFKLFHLSWVSFHFPRP